MMTRELKVTFGPHQSVDRWIVEGRDQHGSPVREAYDVPRGEPVTVNALEITGIRLETVEPGEVTAGEMFAAFEADLEASMGDDTKEGEHMSDTLPGPSPAPPRCTCGRLDNDGLTPCAAHPEGFPHAVSARLTLICGGVSSDDIDAVMATARWEGSRLVARLPGKIKSVTAQVKASSASCACGTVIPCDAHETDDDRRDAMRKIREEMTERVRAFAGGKVVKVDSFTAPPGNPGARVIRTG